MKKGDPIDPRVPWVRPLLDLEEARAVGASGPRLRALRLGGERLGDALREEGAVSACRTLPISDLIYPARFAFGGALTLPLPYVLMRHRCLLVQLRTEEGIKNLLFNPTDRESSRQTPYFRALLDKYGFAERLLAQPYATAEEGLRELGIGPEEIDLIAFDHFHTQDLRVTLGTLGPDGRSPRFPNALLLAPRAAWQEWEDLHPIQAPWFIAEGREGVLEERLLLTDQDLWLGEGCLLLRTPGHTAGNQTLFVHAQRGIFGCSENGTSCDSWSPYESRLPGLRRHARSFGAEVVLNANTPESAEQYTSMILERSVVDRVPEAPAFVQMFPSSEVTPSPLAPGVRPSVVFGGRASGTLKV